MDSNDTTPFFEARAERFAYLACATLILYEYFLQLGAEVDFFWKQRWTIAKSLFIWSRYYGLAFNISNAAVYIYPRPSYELCYRFFHWQNTGASLQVITSHLILQLRLYAMYGNSNYILCLFIFLTLAEALTLGMVFGLPNHKLIGTNEPYPKLFICADADPADGSHWLVYYWMSILIIDSILLCLALYQAWKHRPSTGNGSSLMQTLTGESVIYFFVIFWIYLANLILWIINRITLNELGTSFSFVISSILANRLIISVRQKHFCKRDVGLQSCIGCENEYQAAMDVQPELTTVLDNTINGEFERVQTRV